MAASIYSSLEEVVLDTAHLTQANTGNAWPRRRTAAPEPAYDWRQP
jgi:hypothetical protein